jgi:hypothetical protein
MYTTYVYTISDTGRMIPYVVRSIRSLNKYVDKEDIIVFGTPPMSKLNYARLSKMAMVRLVQNLSKPFVFLKGQCASRYGEKCHLCDVPSSTVVFLDADTIVRKDLASLLEGDFDFSARKQFPTGESEKGAIDIEFWSEIFKNKGKTPVPMPNAGFMIFKNSYHHKIKEQWLKYINDDKLPNACSFGNPKEQTALALALSTQILGTKIRWLSAKEHAFSWLGEENVETYVLHKPKPYSFLDRKLLLWNGRIFRSISSILF